MMRTESIPKMQKNAILARLKATIQKYGYEETKAVINKHMNKLKHKKELEKQIKTAEDGLRDLKKSRGGL